ncbi:MAG: ABC transporter ATP-binding protein [Coprobacillaceae bacterium]
MEKKKILEAKNITKIYGLDTKNPVTALTGVSLTIDEGEFVCIMGPSGSGKSTLINNISTIDIPTKGFVFINNEEIREMSEGKIGKFRYENLGFIFQEFNLLDSLTVFENIAVPLTLAKVPKDEIHKRIEEVAIKLGVNELLAKYPGDCSGGQRQRVAICRALVTNPKLIVADEPTGNLDSKNSHELLSLFKELNEKEGVSIVMVTHDSMIASYSSKLLYIKDGVIDVTLTRDQMTQKEYFYKIVDINSSETQALFND